MRLENKHVNISKGGKHVKIYNKGSFLAGVLCALALLLFLLDLVRAEWWQWIDRKSVV